MPDYWFCIGQLYDTIFLVYTLVLQCLILVSYDIDSFLQQTHLADIKCFAAFLFLFPVFDYVFINILELFSIGGVMVYVQAVFVSVYTESHKWTQFKCFCKC